MAGLHRIHGRSQTLPGRIDANRIAAAFWREKDPALIRGLDAAFQHVLASGHGPVPPGQSVEEYFNANYDALGLRPDYGWFQARMITDVNAEKPPPTFENALLHSQMQKK